MALKQEHGTDEMSKNVAKIGLKQGQWCKQVEFKTAKYWQLVTRLLTSSTWKRGHHFFKKKTRPFPIDLFSTDLNLWHTCKFIPPPWYKGGGGGDGAPPERFWYVAVFWSDFAFSGKRLICSTRWGIFYGWWRCWRPVTSPPMVANLDFTKN